MKIVDPEIQALKDALAVLQMQMTKKKNDGVVEVMKRLNPIAYEVYDELLPTKYKRSIFI